MFVTFAMLIVPVMLVFAAGFIFVATLVPVYPKQLSKPIYESANAIAMRALVQAQIEEQRHWMWTRNYPKKSLFA